MCVVSLNDRKRSVDLYSLLGVQSVDEVVRRGRLKWFGHVECKSGDDWVSALFILFIHLLYGAAGQFVSGLS